MDVVAEKACATVPVTSAGMFMLVLHPTTRHGELSTTELNCHNLEALLKCSLAPGLVVSSKVHWRVNFQVFLYTFAMPYPTLTCPVDLMISDSGCIRVKNAKNTTSRL